MGRIRIVQDRIFAVVLIVTTWCSSTGLIWAQTDYPSRPVKIIVPVSAGGAPDVVARILAEKLSDRFKQPVVVENRPGAGERLGAEQAAKAVPDGYTVLLTPPGALVVAPHLHANLVFAPAAFVPVSILTRGHLVLVTRPNLGVDNVQELVALARAKPGKLTYASPGIGTPPHLAGEMFKLAAQLQTLHVPYKGLAPAVTDLLAGHVDFMFDNLGNSFGHIREGRLKALGIASEARFSTLPDLPTIAESYPSVIATSWFGVVAPPNTPLPIAAHLSRTITEILKLPDVTAKLQAMSFAAVGSGPEETAKFLKLESERWASVISAAGIKPE